MKKPTRSSRRRKTVAGGSVDPWRPAAASERPDSRIDVGRPTAVDEPSGIADASEERLALLKELPFLDNYSNQTYLYLLAVDPVSLYIIWEVGEASRRHLAGFFGPDFLRNGSLVLRVYDVSDVDFDGFNANASFEVDDFLADKISYWVHATGGRHYVAELGYRAPGTLGFEHVARSNTVLLPRGVEETAERYAAWREVTVAPNDVEVPVGAEEWRYNQYLYWKRRSHQAPAEKGFWSLVLHQHLPFVRHPEYDVALEEQWFFEAVASVYTQLLHMMWRLQADKVDFRLTVSLTPPLLSMMQDPLLQRRAARHLDELLALAEREHERAEGTPQQATLAEVLSRLEAAQVVFETYGGDLTRGYREFQDKGKLEVITCAATHYLLPLFEHLPETVRAQVGLACRQYERVFGRPARGIWLPENAFTPGLEKFLAAEGIRWTLCSARGLREGDTRCFYGSAAPVVGPAGVAFFGIDEETRHKIWSREGGYPGSPNYKEWYRDLGYDLPWEDLPEYFRTAGVRRNTGIKLHRIGPHGTELGSKEPYQPLLAKQTLEEQAGQFVFERGAQANHLAGLHRIAPCIVSAYDAELFGHWWEEGMAFLESVFRRMQHEQVEVRPVTPGEFLAEHPRHQQMVPGVSSWGKKDDFSTWVQERAFQPNAWVYRHLFRLCQKLTELATRFRAGAEPLRERALNQAARCLFLAGASDWGFLISTQQAVRYSEVQIVTHLDRAKELLRQGETGEIVVSYLETLESADCLLPWDQMDYRAFAKD